MINMGMIDKFYCVDSQCALDEIISYDCSRNYVLDLDLDFFSKDMDYINEDQKLRVIKKMANNPAPMDYRIAADGFSRKEVRVRASPMVPMIKLLG